MSKLSSEASSEILNEASLKFVAGISQNEEKIIPTVQLLTEIPVSTQNPVHDFDIRCYVQKPNS